MIITPIRTRIFKKDDDLATFIFSYIKRLKEGTIIVVTSKIAALAQGRVVEKEDKKRAIEKDSSKIIRNKWAYLTFRNNEWCINAGADESNAWGKVILLPKNEFKLTQMLYSVLRRKYKLKRFGLILTDTRSMPLKKGTQGMALSYAGFEPIRSYVGIKDLAGRAMKRTEINVTDTLAASAVLMMGEGAEQTPLAIIEGAPVVFTNKIFRKRGMVMRPKEDMYQDVYR